MLKHITFPFTQNTFHCSILSRFIYWNIFHRWPAARASWKPLRDETLLGKFNSRVIFKTCITDNSLAYCVNGDYACIKKILLSIIVCLKFEKLNVVKLIWHYYQQWTRYCSMRIFSRAKKVYPIHHKWIIINY